MLVKNIGKTEKEYWLKLPTRFLLSGNSAIREAILAEGKEQESLHEAARHVRNFALGTKCIVRGVIELTNLCRLSCTYCPMRRGNLPKDELYFLSDSEIEKALLNMRDFPVSVVSFQSGETPAVSKTAKNAIQLTKKVLGDEIEILLCLGILPENELREFRQLGARSYIMKFETSSSFDHKRIRGESLSTRLQAIELLKMIDFKVGTGSIVGLENQSIDDLCNDIAFSIKLKTDMHSVSPFIPSGSTPMGNIESGSVNHTLNAISVLRMLHPKAIIPSVSALEMLESRGQLKALNAGANVMTINFTPPTHANKFQIYKPDRYKVTASHALKTIEDAKMTVSSNTYCLQNA